MNFKKSGTCDKIIYLNSEITFLFKCVTDSRLITFHLEEGIAIGLAYMFLQHVGEQLVLFQLIFSDL